jgi:hypothetical protein
VANIPLPRNTASFRIRGPTCQAAEQVAHALACSFYSSLSWASAKVTPMNSLWSWSRDAVICDPWPMLEMLCANGFCICFDMIQWSTGIVSQAFWLRTEGHHSAASMGPARTSAKSCPLTFIARHMIFDLPPIKRTQNCVKCWKGTHILGLEHWKETFRLPD